MAIITLNNNSLSSVTALPAGVGGKIIQYAADYDTSFISLTTTSMVDTGLSISFTPISSSSTIFIQGCVQHYASGAQSSHGSMNVKVVKDGSDLTETYSSYAGYGGTEALFNGMLPFYHSETSGNTTARTYKVQVANNSNTAGASYNQYGGHSALIILEIA